VWLQVAVRLRVMIDGETSQYSLQQPFGSTP
jgi:hypothetical protein